jgi:hypothetical protein
MSMPHACVCGICYREMVPMFIEPPPRPPHWTCKIHGDFDAMRAVGCPECTHLMRKALLRAFDEHGHRYNCSASRGPHSDCTCGWLEVMELVKVMHSNHRARNSAP